MTDPKHPNRPTHLDFQRLLDVVLQLDGQALEAGRRVDDITAEVIDPKSLAYLSVQRALRVSPTSMGADISKLATMYHEAFIVGYRFHERGGHRSDPTQPKDTP